MCPSWPPRPPTLPHPPRRGTPPGLSAPPRPPPPPARPRPPVQSPRGGHVDFPVDTAPPAALTALARDSAATPFAVLLAAFGVLVHGYTGAQEAIVGSPVAGRTTEAVR